MEKAIENKIDSGLESISSQLYIFSIGLGIVLVAGGIYLLIKGHGSDKRIRTKGWICLLIGIIGLASGFVQLYY